MEKYCNTLNFGENKSIASECPCLRLFRYVHNQTRELIRLHCLKQYISLSIASYMTITFHILVEILIDPYLTRVHVYTRYPNYTRKNIFIVYFWFYRGILCFRGLHRFRSVGPCGASWKKESMKNKQRRFKKKSLVYMDFKCVFKIMTHITCLSQ